MEEGPALKFTQDPPKIDEAGRSQDVNLYTVDVFSIVSGIILSPSSLASSFPGGMRHA